MTTETKISAHLKWMDFSIIKRIFGFRPVPCFFHLDETKLICCFTGQASQKIVSVGKKLKTEVRFWSWKYWKVCKLQKNSNKRKWKIQK